MPRVASRIVGRLWVRGALRYGPAVVPVRLLDTQQCINFQLRRLSRLVARHYDGLLRPSGLSAAQFNILAFLAQSGPSSLSDLARVLGMERSALARNLKPIERKGLVAEAHGTDRRKRLTALTPAGRRTLRAALPQWHRAQTTLQTKLGGRRALGLAQVLADLRRAIGQ